MRRLYLNLFLFVLPLMLGLVLLPINRRMKFIGLKNECSDYGIILHDRIYHNLRPIDVAFMGSSHMMNAINEPLMERKLKGEQTVFNFGYCTLGQNFNYALLKKVVEGKNIKTLVLEVREDEDRYSHNTFPYIADTKDVLFATPFFNRDYFKDVLAHFSYKVELYQDIIFGRMYQTGHFRGDYSYDSIEKVASKNLPDLPMTKNVSTISLNTYEREFHMMYPRYYLEKIATLCERKNINLIFLYLPSYGSFDQPKEMNTYLQYGKVLLPPEAILREKSNWFDEGHLNNKGADVMADWLAKEIDD